MSQIIKNYTKDRYQAVYPVPIEFDGKRLDQFLMSIFQSFSREKIKQKIGRGEIKIEGRPHPHKPSTKIYLKEIIQITTYRSDLEDEYWNGEKIELDEEPKIVFEDEQIIAINKPPFMSAHPTGKHMFNCVTVFFEAKLGHIIHSIHRLDRETSGLMLVGKTPKTANDFMKIFEQDKIKKCYLLFGKKQKKEIPNEFIAEERMGTKPGHIPNLYTFCYPKESKKGKSAKTGFKILYQNDNYVIAMAFLYTGRQHQIRAHAAHHGFPLVGDKLYSGDKTVFMRFKDREPTKEDHALVEIPRQALHALSLKYVDPKTKKTKTLKADIPDDLLKWMQTKVDLTPPELDKIIDQELQHWEPDFRE